MVTRQILRMPEILSKAWVFAAEWTNRIVFYLRPTMPNSFRMGVGGLYAFAICHKCAWQVALWGLPEYCLGKESILAT